MILIILYIFLLLTKVIIQIIKYLKNIQIAQRQQMQPEIQANHSSVSQQADNINTNNGYKQSSRHKQIDEHKVENCIDLEISRVTPAVYGQWKKVNTVSNKISETDTIVTSRTGHACFMYKNSVYFYGGKRLELPINTNQQKQIPQSDLPQPPILSLDSLNSNLNASIIQKQALWNCFHKFNTVSKLFGKQNINFGANSALFNNISHFGWLLQGNSLFVFGGINCETGQLRNSQICSINLQTGSVKRHESKTPTISIPCPRLNPSITALQKSILLIFGGYMFNNLTDTYNYLNDMYIFKIETKTWVKIQDNLHLKFPVLIQPSLINFNDSSLYLMGGCRQINQNKGEQSIKVSNHQIYRLKIVNKTASSKSDCTVKNVYSTNSIPKDQKFVKVMKHGQKGLFVITSTKDNKNNDHEGSSMVSQQKSNTYKYCYWYYDVSNLLWLEFKQTQISQIHPIYHAFNTSYFNSPVQCEDFIIINQKILSFQQNGDILQYNFSQNTLDCVLKQSLTQSQITLCSLCEEEKLLGAEYRNLISAQHMEEYVCALDFPFAAIGLLIDNAVLTNAKVCNIYFNMASLSKDQNNKNVYMIIEDNGQPSRLWAPEMKYVDFLNAIYSFSATVLPQDSIAEEDYKKMFVKSMKDLEQKQKNLQKQFAIFQKNQSKTNNNSNQSSLNSSYSNIHHKTQKDFQKQHQEYIEKKQRLQHKKKALQTQGKCKKFCNSIKLAGIRLGDFVAYACKQKKNQENAEQNVADKEIRRFFIMRKQRCQITGKNCYVCYAFITENGNAIDHKMQNIMKICMKQFKREMKILSDRLKTMNNVVLVSDMRQFGINQQNSPDKNNQIVSLKQLRLKKKQNDVFYGETSILNHLQSNCLTKMSESCDISLKTYLSLLYLNNDNELVMNFSVKQNQPEQINSQPFLPLIDRLLSSKKIIEVSKILDFSDECSVVEVYWLPDYSSNYQGMSIGNKVNGLGFFINGILIYHRNRLINRYQIPLGKLFDELEVSHRNGSIFGYLEIKPQYTANIFQTDMFYPRSFQKYYSRLQFIKQFMENKSKQKRSRGRDDNGSGYQKISKRSKNQ